MQKGSSIVKWLHIHHREIKIGDFSFFSFIWDSLLKAFIIDIIKGSK